MQEERNNQLPKEENQEGRANTEQDEKQERFLSDSQKIVRRHLENENDIITDEDIASVRVGMSPPHLDDATKARFEDEKLGKELEDESDHDQEGRDEANGPVKPITPWDTVDPE